MANKNSSTFEKRKKELARKEKQQKKGEKRAQRKMERAQRGESGPDAGIAGIVPGPQPRFDGDDLGPDLETEDDEDDEG